MGDPIRNERNKLAVKLVSAEELEEQAAALCTGVHEGHAALLDRVMKQWTLRDIEQITTIAVDRGQSLPPDFVKDGELREALCALDSASSPLEVLQAFRADCVIRQYSLFSTTAEEKQCVTLRRVFDWRNYGAVSLPARLKG